MASDTRRRSELLAAEFVLGTLDAAAFRRAALRFDQDEGFARLVDRWAERLEPLAATLPPQAPEAAVWARIDRALDRDEKPKAKTRTAPTRPWVRRFAWGGAALAAAFALLLLVTGDPGPAPLQAVAQLRPESGAYTWIIGVDRDAGALTIRREGAAPNRPQASLELWLIAEGGGPRSLGLLPQGTETTLALPPDALEDLLPGATLAVSLEPLGGSPGGAPTGPVLASTRLLRP
ncbi:anti-sigma factor [Pelagibius sp.]|uniref:anti-sigma factor n=1 Tax=Pelagibius sp. TaxID=1931238 RepID=UPI00260793FD|nr:anti-sigma factor [Pelagibius sp.]